MSGSAARKVQPFTIGTRLSLPKCAPRCPGDSCAGIALASALDSHRGLRRSLNERISLYLAQARTSPAAVGVQPRSPSPGEDDGNGEEPLSCSSLARSIKKITLSDWHGEAGKGDPGYPARTSGERNHNNNNSRPGKAPLKMAAPTTSSPRKESPKGKDPAMAPRWGGQSGMGAAPLLDLSPLVAQFNREMLQAEGWVRGKLLDLKDGCNLQDWEEVDETLQQDIKDFESTLIKLNQMGEQLMWEAGPSGEAVWRQLLALRDQWQLLKQTATSQSKALGGLRSLQDFNRKAERLEAWIRHKEEKPSLAALLQESPDKIQLTRRILDLKQEEQQFHSLHKELNSLAQKLEKQGKSESRSISARRKHLNKMWLRLQGTLKEHHETLQLALEVTSFLQQADMLLRAINTKRSVCIERKTGEGEPSRDRDVRDIASQVMMLDVTVSQLLNLQPSLAAQITPKHQEVKESWAQLQQALRTEKAPASSEAVALSAESERDSSGHGAVGKEAKDKGMRGPGSMVPKDVPGKMAEHGTGKQSSPGSPAAGQHPRGRDSKRRREAEADWGTRRPEAQQVMSLHKESAGSSVSPCQVGDTESPKAAWAQQDPLGPSFRAVFQEGSAARGSSGTLQVEAMLQELSELWEDLQKKHQQNGAVLQDIDKALRLVGELDQAERWLQAVAGPLSEPATMKSPAELRQELEEMGQLDKQLVQCGLKLRVLWEEAADKPLTGHDGARKMQRKVEMVEEKLAHVQAALQHQAADLRDSLVLSEFLQDLQEEETRSQQGPTAVSSGAGQPASCEDMSCPSGELREAVEMLNDAAKERERVMEVTAEAESLECLVAEMSLHLEALRCRAEALARDIAQAESSFTTVKSEKDLQELQGLLSQQQEMEHVVSETLQGQLEELERAAARIQELSPPQPCHIRQKVQGMMWAWAGLQELLREVRTRVQQATRLRLFFKDYLAMISWTEDTRAQIFSDSPSGQGLRDTPCEELEKRIKGKLKEFEALAALGQQLVAEEHYLSVTIKERLEELRSMLGWVLVRWRAQRHQRDPASKQNRQHSECPSGTSLNVQEQCAQAARSRQESTHSPVHFTSCSLHESSQGPEPQLPAGKAISPLASPPSGAPQDTDQSLGEPSSLTPHSAGPPRQAVIWDPTETSTLLLPPRGPGGLGRAVNLILSIGKKGERKKEQLMGSSERPGDEALQMLPVTKHAGCKTLWKRCQGLLGNTWGSLSQKRKPPRQPVEEAQVEARKSSSKQLPTATCCPPAPSSRTLAASHTLPKSMAGSLLSSLPWRERARAEQARLLTLRGIMGAGSLQPVSEKHHGPSNTWPQKCSWRKGGPGVATTGPLLEELYVRNPLVRDIDDECEVNPGDHHLLNPKATCPRVSLGSVLSLELPRDTVVLGSHQEAAARWEEMERQEQVQGSGMRPWNPTGTHKARWQDEVDVDGHSPCQHSKRLGMVPKSEQGIWSQEAGLDPSYSQQRPHHAGEEHCSPRTPGSTGEDLLDVRPRQLSHVCVLHRQVSQDGEKLATQQDQDSVSSVTGRATDHKGALLELGLSPASAPSTVHTQQLAGHSQPEESPATAPTQLSVFEWALGSPCPSSPAAVPRETCSPAHRQFEEEEEELQAIWDQASGGQAPSPQEDSRTSCELGRRSGSVPSPDAHPATSRPFILSSANNVLVAKFTLPSAARLLHSMSGEKSPGTGHRDGGSPAGGHRVSACGDEMVSTAPLDSPDAWDQQRNGEEERESSKMSPSKMEFQRMEGMLERKHLLQAGGRKASCRAWGLFHTVLMRQTLCFYQDHRDSLKSAVVALPLNLSRAVCTPDVEYTKKNNCFRLQLQDGSEYLLRAPSQPLMNEWVSKLQQNSGFPEVDYFQAAAQHVESTCSAGSKVPSPGSTHIQGHHEIMTAKSQEIMVLPRSNAQLQQPLGSLDAPATETVAAAEDVHRHREQQWSLGGSPGFWDNSCQDDYGLVATKRRSYSFTSATYQKITPVAVPKEPVEAGGSYSVTLYIREQVPAMPRARCHSFVAQPSNERDMLGEKTCSPPRPKNKSVFKKFFGKE